MMYLCMIFALPIVVVPEGIIDQAQKTLDILNPATYENFVIEYRRSMKVYGILSGTYMLLLSTALILMFWKVFKLINNGHKLSLELQH